MTPRSIQGEQQARRAVRIATDDEIAEYAANCSPGVAKCRGRNGHDGGVQTMPPRFTHIRDDGLLEAEAECIDCGCATLVAIWEPFTRKVGRKNVPNIRQLSSFIDYHENELGEVYISPFGRMSPKKFRAARATLALDEEALDWVNSALRKQRKHRKEHR